MSAGKYLVWIDLEMTGLDPEKERIIEMATIITDSELNLVAEGPVIAVHQPDNLLDAMDEWCTRTHGESGLTKRVRESKVSEAEAEQQTIAFLKEYMESGKSPLCGNSIGQDRRFLVKYMPQLEDFFHYRNLDVSTVKELARRWRPDVLQGVKKQGSHQALDDIRDSINELRHYREHFFKL
ncbi:oligoribonuclease [Marinobacter antarcticus]|uniref:Oligoribonuclease n=1 Tax=Marinobacter antarcticus TaxID=564117 RepID=A0A1M6RN89_9GAMM|nr:oligoribonuclease [Marinobacter antarcticus]SHK33860.1 oligoribonuclease [Marinobacter antarcticus]